MAKFTTDYVNLIANNLRDRYKTGFPVLKELVQNADDAGATELNFGYHPGLEAAVDHELLRGPALWILNNGRFTASDRQAITSFGLNSKAAEAGAIGKFGLGMKSVFHLCEAFFYVASDGEQHFHEVLSPWFQDTGSHATHTLWESVSQRDADALDSAAAGHGTKQTDKSWFMLWIPLRRRAHVPRAEGYLTAPIIDRFPGDDADRDLDFFTESDIERRIGGLLPLLRHLRRVRFGGTGVLPAFDLQLELQENGKRLDHETDGLHTCGTVADGGPKSDRLHFFATQTVLRNAAPFAALQAADGWPKSNAIVAEGKRSPVPDKGQPEGAVAVTHAERRRGQLVLQWAVFLPTEEARNRYEAYIPDSAREYNITLHGQFFVDAGRRGIDGMDKLVEPIADEPKWKSESAVQLAWNQALAQDLLLPSVLPALAAYVAAEGLSDEHVTALTSALTRCAATGESGSTVYFVANYASYLCRKHAWVRTLRPEGAKWELRQATDKLLLLPRPAGREHERPWRALPGLKQLAGFTFVDSQAPSVSPAPVFWDEELVTTAMADLPKETLTGEVELRYLVEFLGMHKERALNMSRVQGHLVRLFRAALHRLRLSEVRANRQHFKQLMEFLPPSLRFGLGTRAVDAKGTIPESLYMRLLTVDSQALLLPADLAPEGELGRPSTDDIEAWLVQIDQSDPEDVDISNKLDVADALLAAVGGDIQGQADLLRRFPRLRVLRAIDVRSNREIATSLEDLINKHASSLVFRTTDPKNRLGLTKSLALAIIDLEFHVVRGNVAQVLRLAMEQGSPELLAADSASAMFTCIGTQPDAPRLGDLTSRADLLAHVSTADLAMNAVRSGVRYLLHGDPKKIKSSDTLWKDPSGRDSPWVRVWRMATDDAWNVLPSELSEQIPDKCSVALNIQAVEQSTVMAKLRQGASFEAVDAKAFSELELDQILGLIEDETSWRKLPMHRDRSGAFGPITGGCYLGGNPELPHGVVTAIRFIVESNNEAHRQRQATLIPRWSPARAAEEVLRAEDAGHHWRYLMDLLRKSPQAAATGNAWATTAWLPLASGGLISPSSLIQLEGMGAEISALAARCDFAFAGLSELSEGIQSHPAFEQLRTLAPSGATALPVLAALMSDADLKIGTSATADPDLLHRHGALLCSLPSLPAWPLVFKAAAATSTEDVIAHLVNDIALPLSSLQSEQVLRELNSKSLSPTERDVYWVYLREWANSASATELRGRLNQLKFIAMDGTWRFASELASGAPGVDKSHCVHDFIGEILRGIVATNDGAPLALDLDASDEGSGDHANLETAIESWCDPFEQSSVRPAVGALVGLFGADVKALAERWIDPITYADYVRKLGWRDPGYEGGPLPVKRWMGGNQTPEVPFAVLKPAFAESAKSTVQVKALTGETLSLPLANGDSIETMLAGPLNWLGGFGVEVRMRPIECLRAFSVQGQKAILQRTAEDLLRSFYSQDHANLSSLWDLFEDADQVELDIAQSLILEGLPQLMEQLSQVKRHPSIAAALKAVDKGRREIASAQRAKSDLNDPYDHFYGALEDLADLVKSDDSVQTAILAGIRHKIARYQYERSSIPFEILQNADDASVEYQDMQLADGRSLFPADEIGRFVVDRTERGLMLMHWGRPINYTGKHESHRAEYAKDLERMLMLGASAKDAEDGVTGKFGLGFKSVLLATDRPTVASGELHFEIVAGCLPLLAELSAAAKHRAAQYKRTSLRPTIVELPVTEGIDQVGMIERFASLAGLCTVFTRQVKHIEVTGTTHTWSPDRLLDASNAWCELGQVQIPSKRGPVPTRLLVLRCATGDAAIRMEGQAATFDREANHPAPAIWVTEPTRGTAATGFLLNADFEVDTGRGSLPQGAAAKRNIEIARRLAHGVVPALAELVQQTRANWLAWSGRLACSPQIDVAGYWHAAWSVMFGEDLSEDASQDAQLTTAFVQKLFCLALDRGGAVANGMPGQLGGFAQVDELRLAVPSSRLQAVLPALSAWPAFVDVYPPGSWCGDDVAKWLGSYKESDDDWFLEELDRAAIFNALGTQRHLDPADLPHLATVINAWPKGPTEDQGWRNELAKVQLKSRSGAWKPATTLHFGAPGQDDLIAHFAPDDFLLDEAYQAQPAAWHAVGQYLTARDFQPQDMARWCLAAASDQQQRLVMSWLSRNLDAWLVWHHIKTSAVAHHWLLGLHFGHPLLADLQEDARQLVLARLGLAASVSGVDAYVPEELQLDLSVENIHSWWLSHREQHLPSYERALWPQHVDKSKLADDEVDRETWMTLFSLGVFRRFGRVRDEQNRSFLEFLHSRGWWATISEVHPDSGAEQWMNILREYAETNQVTGEFEQWMDSFPRLYRIARWCDDYVDLFRGLEFRSSNEARNLLTPATDASLSGSGFDAPTIHRTLRIGHNLVVRELLRTGVLRSEVAQSKAFMPGRAVLDLLQQMGHTDLVASEDIHALLVEQLGSPERASFGGDYDIPLILLAANVDLQFEVAAWAEQQADLELQTELLEEESP